MWYSPVIIGKFQFTQKSALAIRGELFSDAQQTFFLTGTANGFYVTGYSLNYDYTFAENVIWRIEAKGLSSKTAYFNLSNNPTKNQLYFTTALAISF
jgi:hypothetical protein